MARILLVEDENFGNEPFESVEFGDGAKLLDPDLSITQYSHFELVSLLLGYPVALFSLCRLRVPLLLFVDKSPFVFIEELKNSRFVCSTISSISFFFWSSSARFSIL